MAAADGKRAATFQVVQHSQILAHERKQQDEHAADAAYAPRISGEVGGTMKVERSLWDFLVSLFGSKPVVKPQKGYFYVVNTTKYDLKIDIRLPDEVYIVEQERDAGAAAGVSTEGFQASGHHSSTVKHERQPVKPSQVFCSPVEGPEYKILSFKIQDQGTTQVSVYKYDENAPQELGWYRHNVVQSKSIVLVDGEPRRFDS